MAKRWIQKAIKKPGALRAAARRAGAMTKGGTIKKGWLQSMAKRGGTMGRRARLAITLSKMRRRR